MHNIQHTDMQITSGTVPINGDVTDSRYCCPVTLVAPLTFIPITSFPLWEYITHVCQQKPDSSFNKSMQFCKTIILIYKAFAVSLQET